MKKRKLFLSAIMSIAFVFFGVLMAGCGQNPVDIEIISGIPVEVVNDQNEQPDWSKVKAKILFEDGTERTVDYTQLIFSEVDMTTAGIKNVSVKYKSGEFKITIQLTVIDSTEINAQITAYSGTYDAEFHNAVTFEGTRAGDIISYSQDEMATWSNVMPQFKNAGTYKLYVKISREYRNDQIEEKTVTIAKKQLEVVAENKSMTYGETMPTLTYQITGFVGDETEDDLTTKPQVTCDATEVGTHDILISGGEADNYSFNYTKGTLTINKATYDMSNVHWSDVKEYTYDGTYKTVELVGIPEGITAIYAKDSVNSAQNAGEYVAKLVGFEYDTKNYNAPELPQGVENTCSWAINKAQNTKNYTLTGFSGEYDGNVHTFEINGITDETVTYSTDNINWTSEKPTLKDVGTVTVYVKISKLNYIDVNKQTFITVNLKSEMGVTATGYDGNYTGESKSVGLQGTLSGDVIQYSQDDKQTWQSSSPIFKNATDGVVTVYVKISRTNYEDEILTVQFNIKQVEVTVTVNDATVKYGEDAPEFSANYIGFVNGETADTENVLTKNPSFTCTYQKGANAGETFDITPSGAEAQNYTFVYQKGTLTVVKAEVAKPTKNETIFTYNGTEQTYLPNGFDAEKMQILGNKQTNASIDAYQVLVTPNSNYVWADTNDSISLQFAFVIEQKVAELAWKTTNLIYIGEQQAPVCEVTNLCGNDICEVIVDGKQINVGTGYIATASSLSNANYKLPTSTTCEFNISIATNEWIIEPSLEVTMSGPVFEGTALFGNDTIVKKYKKLSDDDTKYTDVFPTEDGEYNMMVTIPSTENYSELEDVVKFHISNVEIESMSSPLLVRNTENFIHKTNNLVAGTDNFYDLQLIGTEKTTLNECAQFSTNIELYVQEDDNSFTKLAGTDLAQFASIDEYNHYIDFSSLAIGETVKIIVSKDGVKQPLEFVVDIIDGYNVYTANDLSVIENKGIHDWDTFKQGTKYEGLTVNAVAIQKDIIVTDSDIPAEFFYSETEAKAVPSELTNQTIAGTMKDGDGNGTGGDGRAIYHRNVASGETFGFYGNYFNIDYSALTKCVIQSGHERGVVINDDDTSQEKLITTHVSFLKFDGVGQSSGINFVDTSFIGNGQRDDRSANSGGAMLAKLNGLNTNVSNCIYKNCFMGFMFDGGDDRNVQTQNILTDTKGYDSYNTLIYVFGINNLLIKGGEYIGAGGPVMIVDHVSNDKSTGNGGYPSNIAIVGSKLESFVTGNEPWFVSYDATALVPQVTALNAAYDAFGTTFLQTKDGIANLMNLKVVYKSSSAEGITASVVRGEVKYYNTLDEYENGSGYGLDMTTYSKQASANGANMLQNSINGTLFGATTYLIVSQGTDQYVVKLANVTKLLDGDTSVIEGQVVENGGTKYIAWVSGSITEYPSTSDMQLTETLTVPAFVVNEANSTYGLRAETGVTNINFYLFNGMGLMLELYKK